MKGLTVTELMRLIGGSASPNVSPIVESEPAVLSAAEEACVLPARRAEPVRHTTSDPPYLPFIDNSSGQVSINDYLREWALADTERLYIPHVRDQHCVENSRQHR